MVRSIHTSKKDIIWNYIATIFSMASGLILLPLLLWFLSDDELGLWYIFNAITTLVMYFEFGFNPTFARNIVYVLSGAKKLSRTGYKTQDTSSNVDWHLMNTTIKTIRLVYSVLALVALITMCTIGTYYIWTITQHVEDNTHWIAWGIFCSAAFLNLYYLRWITLLRGTGDVESEGKTRTYGKLSQLIIAAYLLLAGFGLLGASIGFLANGLVMRFASRKYFNKHADIITALKQDTKPVTKAEIKEVFNTIGYLAWRDGIVQLALFAFSQAMTIICSLTLNLSETGAYSLLMQLANIVCTLANVILVSGHPAFQSAFAQANLTEEKHIFARGISAYWGLLIIGMVIILLFGIPLIHLFRPNIKLSYTLLFAICIYQALLTNHSNACRFIISMNTIPYMPAYLISAVIGLALSYVLAGPIGLGAWGIILGQAVVQLVYNNWRWPLWITRKLNTTYTDMLVRGIKWWLHAIKLP